MTHHNSDHDVTKLRKALFEALDDERTGMLGIAGTHSHMQPMTHYFDEATRTLRFITSRDTDLAREIGSGAKAHFTVTDKGDLYACMSGQIAPVNDPAKLEELWSPAASMWFKDGKDDPSVLLLEMPLSEAAIWTVDANALQFGIEMVRANMGDDAADLGDHAVINLAA